MLEAGKEERELEIRNNKDHQRVPAIIVVVDGGWFKQAHGHSYNANCGKFGAATESFFAYIHNLHANVGISHRAML